MERYKNSNGLIPWLMACVILIIFLVFLNFTTLYRIEKKLKSMETQVFQEKLKKSYYKNLLLEVHK